MSSPLDERVTTRTLTSILDDSPFKDRPIDLLTVDAEGFDLPVLKSLDWQRYRPRWVIAEAIGLEIEEVLRSPLHSRMSSCGYRLRSWVIHSVIYERDKEPDSGADSV